MVNNQRIVVHIILPEGSPGGIVAEISNRMVKATLIPRNRLSDATKRPEAKEAGLYFLFGQDNITGKPTIYIGEALECYTRLKQQNRDNDFWDTAMLITIRNNTFARSHLKYLEWYCYNKCKEMDKYKTKQAVPTKPYIPKTHEADSIDIYDTLTVLLFTLGYNVFEGKYTKTRSAQTKKEDIFIVEEKVFNSPKNIQLKD